MIGGVAPVLRSTSAPPARPPNLIIDYHGTGRVFAINAGQTVSMSGLTVQNGDAAGNSGGGIVTGPNGRLTNVSLTGDSAQPTNFGQIRGSARRSLQFDAS